MMAAIDYRKINLLVLDVDGVLTDGRIILTPQGDEIKAFNVRDGAAMKWWRRLGKKIALLTGRSSPAVDRRARDLGVDAVRLGAKRKLPDYLELLAELKEKEETTAVMGDDLPDLPLMRSCALAMAPADAAPEVRKAAQYVTKAPGGAGCVRESIEMILQETGEWKQVLQRYLAEGGAE
jgi:3-deoxy-D-manno-octulosonate 8-phosphate phosphatase (KDO 8-P phosphatase)